MSEASLKNTNNDIFQNYSAYFFRNQTYQALIWNYKFFILF